jgi:hypothetical protein
MKPAGRAAMAVALSVAAHVLALAVVIGTSLIGSWPSLPVEVEVTSMKMEEPRDLPLGGPAAGDQRQGTQAPPPAAERPIEAPPKGPGPRKSKPKPRPAPPVEDQSLAGGAAPPRPRSVRAYAPEGSRVTALLRVDRLRDTPYATLVDAMLMRLPDRRDLLEGTGLDLYRDVDALLVATPNPVDPTVTFLAVRHHLTDGALRAALDKGARATGRKLTWRTERGRPFAERRPGAADQNYLQRDARLILLATPKLAVIAPPAYRNLILQGRPAARPASDAGLGGGGGSDATAGAGGAPGHPPADEHADWAALVRRIDAEDSIMPADAVAMLSLDGLFASHPAGPRAAPGTRGTDDDSAAPFPAVRVYGLPLPPLLTATLGVTPQPFADVDGTFTDETDAVAWEAQWPALKRKLMTNPLVVLTGFSGLLGRVTVTRAGASLHIRIDATEMELVRILQLLATQAFPLGG